MEDFSRHYQIHFKDPELLRLALTHRSYLSVSGKGARASNERLEFLGDSVLGLVTSEFLYRAHPTEHEGELTKTKSLLVSKAILSRRALAMGLGRFVFMSHSEVESGGRQRLSILADGFESVVAAIYLDQGFETAREFIHRWLLNDAREISADKRHTNYKSHLQEYVQSTFRTHPVYRIRSEMGPDHSKQFMVDVMVGRRLMGSGKGRNKKEAEQAAARDALERAHHKVVRDIPAGELPPAAVHAHTTVAERDVDDDEDGRLRRRRGRRGARARRDEGESVVESATATNFTIEEPDFDVESSREPRPEPRREPRDAGRRVRRAEPRELRSESRPEPRPERRPERASVVAEPGPVAAFDEDDFEEIGRPEGPLEERHVDPFAIEEDVTQEVTATNAPGGFGRTVVGPMHRGARTDFERLSDDPDEPEGRSFRRAPDARTAQEPRSAPEYRSAPERRPAREPRVAPESWEAESDTASEPPSAATTRHESSAESHPESEPSAPESRSSSGGGTEGTSQAAYGRRPGRSRRSRG